MKQILLFLVSIICLSSCTSKCGDIEELYDYNLILKDQASIAETYIKNNKLCNSYCILVDYSLPSGTPRGFVWSFLDNEAIASFHVMHGAGKGSTAKQPVYSNEVGSHCSSLGHFEITRVHGKINTTGYRLVGLDTTNSNAWDRALMLHSAYWVDINNHRKYIPLNDMWCQGCITIGTTALEFLADIINSEQKHLLLVTYDSSLHSL